MKHTQSTVRFLPIFISLFLLNACETAQVQKQPQMSPKPRVTNNVPLQPSEYGKLPNYDYQISSASTGNVTVYSLDGAPPAIAPRIAPGMAPTPIIQDGGSVMTYGLSSYEGTSQMRTSSRKASDEQIFFKDGSSRLGTIDKQKIGTFADKAKSAPVKKITVEGFASRPTQVGTDTVEAHVLNLKESMNRSFAVSKTLMHDGLPAEKIKTVSHGSVHATGDHKYDRRVDMTMGEQ